MSLWGSLDQANNGPKFVAIAGAKAAANGVAGGNTNPRWISAYGNTTPDAIVNGIAVGVFGVDNVETALAHNKGLSGGWVKVIVGTGPVTALVANGSSSSANVANGETITISGGSQNAIGTITSNATGNIASIAVTTPGFGFTNVASVTAAFNREQHISTITVGGTPTSYNNTDYIVVSNGIANGRATISTNATGGFVTGNVSITNVGLFSNVAANASLVFSVKAANGAASNGSGATFTGNLITSTGGSVTGGITLGGRSGRIQYETLVAMHITSENTGDNNVFPNT